MVDIAPAEVSVIIVTYNSGPDVQRAVASLAQSMTCTYEVMVVDNASTDGQLAELQVQFPGISAIQMRKNLGFAAAVNTGIRASASPFVLILNPDAVASEGSIDTLLEFARGRRHLGIAAPRLTYPDGRDQGTARSFPTAAAGLFGRRSPLTRAFPGNRWSTRFLSGMHGGTEPFRCDWVSGACMLVPRSAIAATGGFDERYFLFWEDADWCHRLVDAGFEVWTVPGSVVIHAEGGSRRGWPLPVVRHFHRGAYIYWKTFEAPQAWNPLRWIAAVALAARAGCLMAINVLSTRPDEGHAPSIIDAAPDHDAVAARPAPIEKDITV